MKVTPSWERSACDKSPIYALTKNAMLWRFCLRIALARILGTLAFESAFLHCTDNNKDGKYLAILTVFINGGDKRIRTADLLNANQALYQLSYTPVSNV